MSTFYECHTLTFYVLVGAILIISLTMWWTTTGRLMRGVRRHFFGNRAAVPDDHQNPAGPVVNNIPLQPVPVADGGADGAPA